MKGEALGKDWLNGFWKAVPRNLLVTEHLIALKE